MTRKTLQRFKDWTGFFAYTDPEGDYHRGKTLWDLLQLLIIPLVLAGVGLLFNRSETIRQESISLDRQQEEALQSYLNNMENLLFERNLRTADRNSEVRDIARARTLTVLHGLDPGRKSAVITFLYEAALIYKSNASSNVSYPIIGLGGADLVGADLKYTLLDQVSFRGANLNNAQLQGSHLWDADLVHADLVGANLERAYLWHTSFFRANLQEANLWGADLEYTSFLFSDLQNADLRYTHLQGTNFEGANLTNARVDLDSLEFVELSERTIMPDGTKYYDGWFEDKE